MSQVRVSKIDPSPRATVFLIWIFSVITSLHAWTVLGIRDQDLLREFSQGTTSGALRISRAPLLCGELPQCLQIGTPLLARLRLWVQRGINAIYQNRVGKFHAGLNTEHFDRFKALLITAMFRLTAVLVCGYLLLGFKLLVQQVG